MESVEKCSSEGRETQCVVSDLCGALLRGRNPFCYFLLVCLEGSGVIRSLLLLCAAPLVWLLYTCVSAAFAMKLMIFISMRGVKASAIHGVAMAVLPKFFVEDINAEVWRVFSCFGRKVLVTALPRVLVEPFAVEYMGVDAVMGTEIQVDSHGIATGFVKPPGYVLSGFRKTEAVRRERIVDVWLLKAGSAAHSSSICKEWYSVKESSKADPLPKYKLPKPVIFHDGRLVQRPDPWIALLTFVWMPLGFLLAVIRITAGALLPMHIQYYTFWMMGVRIRVRGNPPDPVNRRKSSGTMFVSSHRTLLDPIMLSASLGRPIAAVTYSISRLSEFLSPIPTVRLTRNRDQDAANISKVLQMGDMVLCPEGTTCREPFLLRYSAMFAELAEHIVPVAVNCRTWMFHGSTSRGWKALDPFFFFMNPSPVYEIHFLSQIPVDLSCRGGKSCHEVANSVQKITAGVLGFECTNFTRKDKYRLLAGNDGYVRS
ncbi:hypothetical protein SUGI_1204250 [Cryptomeria japonica]|uniref:glycerol-3-phosphate acyltransferase RAM2 n=1 Tax=Cryptomeria japonica TaxID=3369 RepID=UPI002414983F|nr:glycerol-3-phosphate acyltransferase RAM2 [Cryptomeria japonica]GLJ56095.1 hypothetical protein SUGI_1204250 [Cryptomeria japonica]